MGTAATSDLLYRPQMIDEDDCGAIGGMKIGRGNRSIRRKPAPAPLCPSQIPHDQAQARLKITLLRSVESFSLSKLAQAVTLQTCTGEVIGSNLGRYTSYPDNDFSWFYSVPQENYFVYAATVSFQTPSNAMFTKHPHLTLCNRKI
jgi:hypothetical protein